MTERSDMAILIGGYLLGTVSRPEFSEHFRVAEIRTGPSGDGSPPEFFEIEFASGTTVRVRVEDAPE